MRQTASDLDVPPMTDAKRILFVGADDVWQRVIAAQLSALGFAVRSAGAWTTPEGWAADDVLLVDGDLDPARVEALGRDSTLPMVVAGGRQGPAGAAAWLAKPVRIQALALALERAALGPAPPLRLGTCLFDAGARRLADEAGWTVALTEKEAAIIAYLAKAAPRPVSRPELLAAVWRYADGATTHTVETHIYRLRRKLGAASALIQTEADGYRLADPAEDGKSRSTTTGT